MGNMSKNVINLINWDKNILNWKGKWMIAKIIIIIVIVETKIMGAEVKAKV